MIEKCVRAILNLLPPGIVWNREPTSNIYKLASALADEMNRVEGRGLRLLLESDPRSTNELISDWERVLGLPGDCVDLAGTLEERRAAVVAKLISRMAQTKAFYVQLAASVGYTITVNDVIEFDAFRCEDRCEEPAYGTEWAHVFSIILPANTTRYFRAEDSRAEDRVAEFGDALLECVISDNKPAHSVVLFEYE